MASRRLVSWSTKGVNASWLKTPMRADTAAMQRGRHRGGSGGAGLIDSGVATTSGWPSRERFVLAAVRDDKMDLTKGSVDSFSFSFSLSLSFSLIRSLCILERIGEVVGGVLLKGRWGDGDWVSTLSSE